MSQVAEKKGHLQMKDDHLTILHAKFHSSIEITGCPFSMWRSVMPISLPRDLIQKDAIEHSIIHLQTGKIHVPGLKNNVKFPWRYREYLCVLCFTLILNLFTIWCFLFSISMHKFWLNFDQTFKVSENLLTNLQNGQPWLKLLGWLLMIMKQQLIMFQMKVAFFWDNA